jgi:hypothetical protein
MRYHAVLASAFAARARGYLVETKAKLMMSESKNRTRSMA